MFSSIPKRQTDILTAQEKFQINPESGSKYLIYFAKSID